MPGIESFLIPGAEFALSGLESLFGQSPDDERKARYRKLVGSYREAHDRAIKRSVTRTAGYVGGARQAAAERAAATGRTPNAESYILPAEQRAQQVGTEDLNRVNEFYDTQELGIERDFADRPIAPNLFDYGKEALGTFGEMLSNDKLVDAVRQPGAGAGILPTADIKIGEEDALPRISGEPVSLPGDTSSNIFGPNLEASSARRYSSTFKRRKKINATFEEPHNSMMG